MKRSRCLTFLVLLLMLLPACGKEDAAIEKETSKIPERVIAAPAPPPVELGQSVDGAIRTFGWENWLAGDSNNDMTVNGQDVFLLAARYLQDSNWNGHTATTDGNDCIDANRDGVISGLDLFSISVNFQCRLDGWNVYEGAGGSGPFDSKLNDEPLAPDTDGCGTVEVWDYPFANWSSSWCVIRAWDDSAGEEGGDSAVCDPPTEPYLASIELDPPQIIVEVDKQEEAFVTGRLSDGQTVDIAAITRWSTNPESIAIVDNDGTVTGVSEGTAALYANCYAYQESINIFVTNPPDLTPPEWDGTEGLQQLFPRPEGVAATFNRATDLDSPPVKYNFYWALNEEDVFGPGGTKIADVPVVETGGWIDLSCEVYGLVDDVTIWCGVRAEDSADTPNEDGNTEVRSVTPHTPVYNWRTYSLGQGTPGGIGFDQNGDCNVAWWDAGNVIHHGVWGWESETWSYPEVGGTGTGLSLYAGGVGTAVMGVFDPADDGFYVIERIADEWIRTRLEDWGGSAAECAVTRDPDTGYIHAFRHISGGGLGHWWENGEGGWNFQTVDDGGGVLDVGHSPSIATNYNGDFLVAWGDATNDDLWWSEGTNDAGDWSWINRLLAGDGAVGQFHGISLPQNLPYAWVVYQDQTQGRLMAGNYIEETWWIDPADLSGVFSGCAIWVDSSGNVHMSYLDEDMDTWKFSTGDDVYTYVSDLAEWAGPSSTDIYLNGKGWLQLAITLEDPDGNVAVKVGDNPF